MEDFFELGRVLKPQGIRGEIKLEAYTDDLNRFEYLEHVFIRDGGMRRLTVESKRTDADFAYLKLEGVGDRDAAEALRGTILYIDRNNAAKLPPGHHYIADMIGLAVVDTNGRKLGRLAEVIQTGAVDVLRVEGERGMMFPSIPQVMLKTEMQTGRIIVDAERLQEVCVYEDI